MFTSRKQKLMKLYLLIKDAEFKNNLQAIQKYVSELKFLNLTDNEIKEMEFDKYYKNKE